MFGLETLDVAIGLVFVYLLLALFCSAANEYVSALLNARGKHLKRGIDRLLKDSGLAEEFWKHPLIEEQFGRRRFFVGKRRKPSYIPARTFALTLVRLYSQGRADPGAPVPDAVAAARSRFDDLVEVLRSDAPGDVVQALGFTKIGDALGSADLPPDAKARLVEAVASARTDTQRLQDSVEVWYNNAMDRVTGAYKRSTQLVLLALALLVSLAWNADTIQIWRALATDDRLRAAVVDQAVDHVRREEAGGDATASPAPGTSGGQTPAERVASTREAVDSLEAQLSALGALGVPLGWKPAEAAKLGLARYVDPADPARGVEVRPWPWQWNWGRPLLLKLLGLLLTALAVSMGAPFWFDVLNKFINVRAAGRAPDEKAKSPEAPGKRLAEVPIK